MKPLTYISSEPKGKSPKPCAVHCWFPTASIPYPTMCKVKTEDGDIITINRPEIISTRYINHFGGEIIEYRCRIANPYISTNEIYLHYYVKKLEWTISVP